MNPIQTASSLQSEGETQTPYPVKMGSKQGDLPNVEASQNGHRPTPQDYGLKERRPSRTVDVHLWWPTHDRRIMVKKRLALNGWYRDEKAGIDVPLHPKMAMNQGAEVHIDVERAVQIKYDGIKGWIGVDGRYSIAANVGRDAQYLQAARGKDYSKVVMWGSLVVIAAIFGLVLALGIVAGN